MKSTHSFDKKSKIFLKNVWYEKLLYKETGRECIFTEKTILIKNVIKNKRDMCNSIV